MVEDLHGIGPSLIYHGGGPSLIYHVGKIKEWMSFLRKDKIINPRIYAEGL